jgi:hypothetical protein
VQERSIVERIQVLEQNVAALEQLPARMAAVELQIVQLREEMRDQFSATRADLREEMNILTNHARQHADGLNEESRRHAVVLYEDLKATILAISEGTPRSRKKKNR